MLIDAKNLLSDAQAITSDAISTNVIDLLPSGGAINAGDTGGPTANTVVNIGGGKPLYLYMLVTTVLDTAGEAGTLDVTVESDDNTSLSSATVHLTLTQVAEATLVAGYWIAKGVVLPNGSYQRYVGVRYNVNNGDVFTSGNISAWISDSPYADEQYYSGIKTGVN